MATGDGVDRRRRPESSFAASRPRAVRPTTRERDAAMTNDAIDGDATRERDAVALLASSRAADDVARSIDAMTDEITRLRRGDAGAGAGEGTGEGGDGDDLDELGRSRLRVALTNAERLAPMTLLFTAVFIYEYFFMLFCVAWLAYVSASASVRIVDNASAKERARMPEMTAVGVILLTHLGAVVCARSASDGAYGGKMWRRLLFVVPRGEKGSCGFIETVLEMCVVDYAAKHVTMLVKIGIISLPIGRLRALVGASTSMTSTPSATTASGGAAAKMPTARVYRRRAAVLSTVEYASLIVRAALPTPMWCAWFQRELVSLFAWVITGLYVVIKLRSVIHRVGDFVATLGLPWAKNTSSALGESATSEELMESGNQCAICQEACVDATKLTCSHIFCQDCIAEWFERQPISATGANSGTNKTCPVCRAVVQRGSRKSYGDGTTEFWPMVF